MSRRTRGASLWSRWHELLRPWQEGTHPASAHRAPRRHGGEVVVPPACAPVPDEDRCPGTDGGRTGHCPRARSRARPGQAQLLEMTSHS